MKDLLESPKELNQLGNKEKKNYEKKMNFKEFNFV